MVSYDSKGEVEVRSPRSHRLVALRFDGVEAFGGGERFVRHGCAVDARDDSKGEIGDGGCEREGVELVGAFGEVEDIDLLKLEGRR